MTFGEPCCTKRPTMGGLRILLGLLVVAGGCASDLPRRSAQRPLTLPRREHRITTGAGPTLDEGEFVGLELGYGYGITDAVEARFPLGLRVRLGGEAEGAAWGFDVGVLPRRLTGGRRLEDADDPRQPSRFVDGPAVAPSLGLIARVPLGSQFELRGRIGGIAELDEAGWVRSGYELEIDSVWSPSDWVSASAQFHLREGANGRSTARGGVVAHLSSTVDILVLGGGTDMYEVNERWAPFVAGYLDWHFR